MVGRSDRDERVDRLREARQQRSAEAMVASKRAVMALRNRGHRVTAAAVAREAGVSVSYLTKNPELRQLLQQARREPTGPSVAPSRAASDATVQGLRNKVTMLGDRLRLLEANNTQLREENAALRGEVVALRRQVRGNRNASK